MSATTTNRTGCEEERGDARREFTLVKKNGLEIGARIPEHLTIGDVKNLLAERAGYESELGDGTDDDGMGVRLAVETDGGFRLYPDETRFRDLQAGAKLKPIRSLAPAGC
ncbi:MAG: hypothetical protein FJ276_06550 [Planctomycetes bacterium]|nr:hypothetical protein [Planctomycetota bacterium]